MIHIPDAGRLAKASLAIGLLLIFVVGLAALPEVGLRVLPERYWSERLRDTRYHLMKAEMQQDKLEAVSMALERGKERGFPALPGCAEPTAAGIRQFSARLQVAYRRHKEIKVEMEEIAERYRRLMDAAGGKSLTLAPGAAVCSSSASLRE